MVCVCVCVPLSRIYSKWEFFFQFINFHWKFWEWKGETLVFTWVEKKKKLNGMNGWSRSDLSDGLEWCHASLKRTQLMWKPNQLQWLKTFNILRNDSRDFVYRGHCTFHFFKDEMTWNTKDFYETNEKWHERGKTKQFECAQNNLIHASSCGWHREIEKWNQLGDAIKWSRTIFKKNRKQNKNNKNKATGWMRGLEDEKYRSMMREKCAMATQTRGFFLAYNIVVLCNLIYKVIELEY